MIVTCSRDGYGEACRVLGICTCPQTTDQHRTYRFERVSGGCAIATCEQTGETVAVGIRAARAGDCVHVTSIRLGGAVTFSPLGIHRVVDGAVVA